MPIEAWSGVGPHSPGASAGTLLADFLVELADLLVEDDEDFDEVLAL
jgi:hypothetical protein